MNFERKKGTMEPVHFLYLFFLLVIPVISFLLTISVCSKEVFYLEIRTPIVLMLFNLRDAFSLMRYCCNPIKKG